MGIYCIQKDVISQLQPNQPYGFDNLMIDGIQKKSKLGAYLFDGFWLDIGRPDDYEYANDNWEEIAKKLQIEK
jgi:NDP-sugar pyrophosphorylase family protein